MKYMKEHVWKVLWLCVDSVLTIFNKYSTQQQCLWRFKILLMHRLIPWEKKIKKCELKKYYTKVIVNIILLGCIVALIKLALCKCVWATTPRIPSPSWLIELLCNTTGEKWNTHWRTASVNHGLQNLGQTAGLFRRWNLWPLSFFSCSFSLVSFLLLLLLLLLWLLAYLEKYVFHICLPVENFGGQRAIK